MKYVFHEGSLIIPGDWRDESMNIFKTTEAEGYNLVVSRERIPRSLDPEAHAASQRKTIEDNLPGFTEVERSAVILDGRACVWLEYSWNSPEGPMNQVNVMLVVNDILVSFTFTSGSVFNDMQRKVFREVLASYKCPAPEAAGVEGGV